MPSLLRGFPGGAEVKLSACNVGDLGSIPLLGISPGEGNGNPLQYSCLENLMDRGAWWATVHRVAKSQTRLKQLGMHAEDTLKPCQKITQVMVVQSVKNLPAKAEDIRDVGLISGSGRFPKGGHGNPLQYSCLENPKDRGAWWATVHRVAKS